MAKNSNKNNRPVVINFNGNSNKYGSKMFFNILSIAFLLLVLVALFRQLTGHGSQILSFASMLDIFSRSQAINVSALPDLTIYGYWGPFDFLRNFFNVITGIGNFALFFSANVINVIYFIWFFLVNLLLF